jgi:hypothetical protein
MPLHRTITFHLGLFPIILLLWAWADSVTHSISGLQPTGDRNLVAFSSMNSRIDFFSVSLPVDRRTLVASGVSPFANMDGRLSRTEIPSGMDPPWFPAPRRVVQTLHSGELAFHHSRVVLPYWLIITCYLPLWLAASFWHARRKTKRLLQSLPSPALPQTDLDLGT